MVIKIHDHTDNKAWSLIKRKFHARWLPELLDQCFGRICNPFPRAAFLLDGNPRTNLDILYDIIRWQEGYIRLTANTGFIGDGIKISA